MKSVLLGLGANEGEPLRQIRDALARIEELLSLDAISAVYRTEPVGWADQPDFLNLVCRGQTDLDVREVHRELARIESGLGRERRPRNAPRRIDIDLLAFGELVLNSPDLVVPHPRLHERAFVLVPLIEVAPEWEHPVLGGTAREHLAALSRVSRVERVGRLEEVRPQEP